MPISYATVDEELKRGRFWRAKEILSGRLASSGYDAELFGRYADVLACMQDDDAAGRFYFLSGRRDGEAGRLSQEFLRRRAAMSFEGLWATMPGAAWRTSKAGVPEAVRREAILRFDGDARMIEAFFDRVKVEGEKQRKLKMTAVPPENPPRLLVILAMLLCVLSTLALVLGANELIKGAIALYWKLVG